MADIVDKLTRSRMMSGIRGKNTKPELEIRRGLHRRGFRYRLHQRNLPGKPDLVLRRHNALLFVQGCFWHGHDCSLFKWPTTRKLWWRTKIEATRERDLQAIYSLKASGWRVAQVWECALKGPGRIGSNSVLNRLEKWLLSDRSTINIRGKRND